jgi:predicted AAA+ superfamily ATPase
MELIDLHPLSQGELAGRREGFVDELFNGGAGVRMSGSLRKREYLDRAVVGGFPEAVARSDHTRRVRWFAAYIRTLLQRDIRDLMDIERGRDLGRLLRLLAARTATVLNIAGLSRDIELPQATLRRYLDLLEMTFIIARIPAWSNNLTKRVVRAPKLVFADTGVTAHLLGATTDGLMLPTGNSGQILEAFVVSELRKQLTWARTQAGLYHYRSRDGVEVDAVIEASDGRVACVEVKAAATVRESDFRGLRQLAELAGTTFVGGVLLYTGTEPLSFGGNQWALPLSSLWATETR